MNTLTRIITIGLLALTVSTQASTLTLSGSGETSTKGSHETTGGLNVGYFVGVGSSFEVGGAQSLTFNDKFGGSTKVGGYFLPFHGRLQPYLAGLVGATYGNGQTLWSATPKVGVRFYPNKNYDVFVFGDVGYDFVLANRRLVGSDTVNYSAGMGMKF